MLLGSFALLASIGLAAALMLTLASKFFYVQEDPKIAAVNEALPGANCGGCGFAGCEGYAQAVVTNPSIAANLCCVGGTETAAKVGTLTGKSVGDAEPSVAFRRCQKNEGQVASRYFYDGMDTCSAAARLNNGTAACSYACLGYGDCVRACPFNALVLRDGLPWVLTINCTSCGNCAKVCPRGIMTIIPRRSRVAVFCSTKDKLKEVSDVCQVGCIKCARCIKACPAKAVSLKNNRIEIDHAKCLEYGPECGEACVESCPRKILRRICPTTASVEEAREQSAEADEKADASIEKPQVSHMDKPESRGDAQA